MVCFNCRKGIITAKLWRPCGTYLLLFSWRSPTGAIKNLFLNYSHHVWVNWSAGLMNRKLHFGIRIFQGTMPSGFPVFWVFVPACSWNRSGANLYLRVQRNSSSFDKASKKRETVRLNSWDYFLVTLRSISINTWMMYSSFIPWTNVLCDWHFLALSCVSLETAANFCLFLCFAILRKKQKLNSF